MLVLDKRESNPMTPQANPLISLLLIFLAVVVIRVLIGREK